MIMRPGSIQMVDYYPDKQVSLIYKENKDNHLELESQDSSRLTGNIIWFWIIAICTAAIPFINLLLFFIQPFQLLQGIDKSNLIVQNFGRLENFTYFYLVSGIYGIIIISFVTYSCFFGSFKKRFKLYSMVDNILICMLATDIAYGALHIISFTTVYSSDEEYNLVPSQIIFWQDYMVIILYSLANFAYTGIFRILMIHIYWKPWQTIVYKLGIIISSLAYIAIGLLYIFGNDALSKQVEDFNQQLNPIIDFCYNYSEFFSVIPYLQREQSSLQDAQNKINGFILLYVFTNFAFSFEIVAKLTDFDGTSDLKTMYKLEQQQSQ